MVAAVLGLGIVAAATRGEMSELAEWLWATVAVVWWVVLDRLNLKWWCWELELDFSRLRGYELGSFC